jgi:signal transduction histidine kinase/CheY-like chemotaxis protein
MGSDDPPPSRLAFLSTAPATARDRALALAWVLGSCVAFVGVLPFVRSPLPPLPAFIPAYEAALALNDLITAVLLFGQASQVRSRAVLILAGGYLFDAQVVVLHALSFPGVFAEHGIIGGGPQTTAWIYQIWHAAFPLFVLCYALVRDGPADRLRLRAPVGLLLCVLAVSGLTLGIALLTTIGHDRLPVLLAAGDYTPQIVKGISPGVLALSLAVLLVLWRRNRGTTLDLWLMVVLCAWMFDVALASVLGSRRYDLGFYAGRIYGLIAASFVLTALLREMQRLYGLLATALAEAETRNAELARSREEFARIQRFEAVSHIVGGVAHDFNNLLTVVTGSLDLMQRRPEDTTRTRRLCHAAMDAAQRGQRLTRQLLTFARRQVLRPEVVNPNEIIAGLSNLIQRASGERVRIRTDLSPVLWPTRLDAAEFEAALLNLVVNARDAMGGVGEVAITTANVTLSEAEAAAIPDARPGEHVMVMVRDTGSGMTREVIDHAFEPFFTTKEVGKGSGLGLSQVYGFVRGAGGCVHLDSVPGAGTTVRLWLPKSREMPRAPAAEPALPLRPAVGHETILVVEDEPAVLDVAVEGLRELGYRVRVAHNAAEALAVLRAGAPVDVLFSDVVMPGGMNGAQLAVEARRLRPALKVLLTSGYAASVLTQDHGVPAHLDVLGKPYQREDLARKLRVVIGE